MHGHSLAHMLWLDQSARKPFNVLCTTPFPVAFVWAHLVTLWVQTVKAANVLHFPGESLKPSGLRQAPRKLIFSAGAKDKALKPLLGHYST